jgi:hypothetical protein
MTVWTLVRTFFFIVIGWYLIKWLAMWITGGARGAESRRKVKKEEDYESLTDQKIDDADYEDL